MVNRALFCWNKSVFQRFPPPAQDKKKKKKKNTYYWQLQSHELSATHLKVVSKQQFEQKLVDLGEISRKLLGKSHRKNIFSYLPSFSSWNLEIVPGMMLHYPLDSLFN